MLDLQDFKKVLQYATGEGKQEFQEAYGRISTSSTGTILRKIIELEQQGADLFFGEKSFDVNDLTRIDENGRGYINIIRLTDIQDRPKLFSTFMLSLLAEVYATFPEQGDSDRPELVLFIDEAQDMSNELLEQVRLLSNLETDQHKLLQIVLIGQPELRDRLDQKELRQLRQRIAFSYRLEPLSRRTLVEYVQHRLQVAGHQGSALFSDAAIGRLHRSSNGIPRLVNLLCHKALMAAYGAGDSKVGVRHVGRAATDTEDARQGKPGWLALASGLAGLIALTSAGLIYAYGP